MIIFNDFKSSNVKEIRYDEKEQKLYVEFLRKNPNVSPRAEYVYSEVSDEEFQVIKEAESVGSTLRKVIKGKQFERVLIEVESTESSLI